MADSPADLDPSATHASRNPSREILPGRKKKTKKKTTAQKQADALKKAQAQAKVDRLNDELEMYYQNEEGEVQAIAERTGYSVEHVRRMLKTWAMKKHTSWDPTMHNAMVKFKIDKMNESKCTFPS